MSAYPKEYFYKKIVMSKHYIENYYAEKIDVGNIANETHFSKFDFIRQFKKTYGKTPYNYLKFIRLNKACELLKDTNISVQEVCYNVGYESVSSFSGLFKKEFDFSPKEFRMRHNHRIKSIEREPLNYIPGCFAYKNGWKNSNFEEVELIQP